ncbi:MAG TPA: ABC transporter permease [Gemmatimonadaceae bacterium]|nr:ABC transporter permease [Gemmatimonadaceae bacterium]
MDTLLHDVRYALRQLRVRPRFTIAALVTLALGIGVNTAVFSLANWVVLRPVPGVRDPGRLVVVQFVDETHRFPRSTSYPNLADLGARVDALSGLAGHTTARPVAVQADGADAQYLYATFTSANYFDVLGLRLAAGRAFTHDDEAAARQAPVAIISNRFWRTQFGGDPSVVGRSLTVDGWRTRIIGVAPAGFRGTERLDDIDLWMPGTSAALTGWTPGRAPSGGGRSPSPLESRTDNVFDALVGRLAPHATLVRAQAQLRTATAALVTAYPKENCCWRSPTVYQGIGIPTQTRAAVRRAMLLLAGIAAIVLIIACANVANLFLFRGMGRRTELAVRQALGAPLGRLVRSQLIESLVVSTIAAVPAVLLGVWLKELFHGNVMPGLGAIEQIHLDWRVLAFAGATALVTGIVAGLAPAIATLHANTAASLRGGAPGVSRRTGGLRAVLTSCQLALALSMLVVTFLLVGTVRNLRAVNVGFDADSVMTFVMNPTLSGSSPDAALEILQRSLQRVRTIPGVEAAALGPVAPFMNTITGRAKVGEAPVSDSGIPATSAWVSTDYFKTLGIPLLAGRPFDESEMFWSLGRRTHAEAILSTTLAHRLFGNVNPIGRTVATALPGPPAEVIGLVDDSRWSSLVNDGGGPMQYYPVPNIIATTGATFLVRSSLPPGALRTAVQRAVADVAPSIPLYDIKSLRQRIDATVSEQRLLARLLSAFTLLAVALAVVGLYAVIAFSVAERTRELGIRIALGARSEQIVRMVVRRGAWLGAIGIAIGIGGAVVLSRVVASQLFGVSALDPVVYLLAAALLFALVLLASIIPARHATRVDPVIALRAE